MTYEALRALKYVEEDDFKEGCLPDTSMCFEVDLPIKGETLKDVIEEIKKTYGVESEDIQINACEEPGRIDIVMMEREDGYKATDEDLKLWKIGKKKLYYANYSYQFEKVTRETINFRV